MLHISLAIIFHWPKLVICPHTAAGEDGKSGSHVAKKKRRIYLDGTT